MTKEQTQQYVEVMQAYLDGEVIQFKRLISGQWIIVTEPHWNFNDNHYRVKPKEQLHIDWKLLNPKWKYISVDGDGTVYVYTNKPFVMNSTSDHWSKQGGLCGCLTGILNLDNASVYRRGDVSWRDSCMGRGAIE